MFYYYYFIFIFIIYFMLLIIIITILLILLFCFILLFIIVVLSLLFYISILLSLLPVRLFRAIIMHTSWTVYLLDCLGLCVGYNTYRWWFYANTCESIGVYDWYVWCVLMHFESYYDNWMFSSLEHVLGCKTSNLHATGVALGSTE